MKVPDLAEATGSEKTAQKPKNIDLRKYRKKKKHGTALLKLIVFVLAVIAVIFVWLNASTIFEPLRGIASKVETKTTDDAGFPIELPGSSEYSIMRFGDYFSLLTDTYLYAYDTSGAQNYALKHGYSHPEQATSEKRILLYDKLAYNFALYSKTSLIYQKAVDDKIVYASIGDDGLAAVVTQSKRYANILYIYDDGGNWLYTKKFADENVMQVCSTGDGEHIAVSTVSASKGDILTSFYLFSVRSADAPLWKYTLRTESLPCGMYADKNNVIAACDNCVLSIDTATGEQAGLYGYTGTLKNFFIGNDHILVHYTDISTNKSILLELDTNASAISLSYVSANASCVYCDASGIYVLEGSRVKIYEEGLIGERYIQTPDDDYSDFIKISGNLYMLGYETLGKTNVYGTDSDPEETPKVTEKTERTESELIITE
ncbi:MAG: hypothetical protein II820_05320 [Ruminiclostridium sp.]|nr:hypothetical protein [Ruminiclostridium sp.]